MARDTSFNSTKATVGTQSGTALESVRVLANYPVNLFGIHCFSTTAGYLILIDSQTAPANGAAIVPKKVFPVPANGALTYDWSAPVRFSTGCVAVFSTNASPFTYTPSATAFISGECA